MPKVDKDLLADAEAFRGWAEELRGRLNADQQPSSRYDLEAVSTEDNAAAGLRMVVRSHGVARELRVPRDFFQSTEYRKIYELGAHLEGLLGDDAYVQKGERRQEVSSFKQALNWLMDEGKRGQHIQRYKGLGEMNPDQLWETTMDPDTRRLLRVDIEDAVAADEIFTTLMGDQVEPRREFIEQNALSVENLDV
jgi:DNA gyrase subunit B